MKTIKGPLHWGIIGCGDVCEVKSGPAFNKVTDSRLVAVMRRDKTKAQDYAERHGVELFYDDADMLLRDDRVNAIYISTPPAFHEYYTIKSLQAGKPVYVEKPVSVDKPSVERMIEASRRYAVPVSVAHYRRGLPLFQEVKAQIDSGTLGRVQLVMVKTLQPSANNLIAKSQDNWRINPELSGGGLFHDLSPHQLDILTWIFGKPTFISGKSVNQLHQYNAPDVTSLQLTFSGDVFFQGLWAFQMAEQLQEDSCVIIGTVGTMSFSFFRNRELQITQYDKSESNLRSFPAQLHIQQPMIEKVSAYFRGEIDNPCSLEEALVSMEIMDATH